MKERSLKAEKEEKMKKNIGIISAIIFFTLFVVYSGFETIKVVLGPSLTITSPKKLETVHSPLVTVRGIAKRVAFITVNDRQIFVDTKGEFMTELLVPMGYTIIKVTVRDRFGKEITEYIPLSYTP